MKFSPQKFYQNTWLKTAVSREMALSIILIALPVFFPKTVYAGLFSLFSRATSDEVSAKSVDISNKISSQNMVVLKAAVNQDPNPNKSMIDAPYSSGNALLAEIGPSGSITDITEDPTNTQISIYIVRSGDTLGKIAGMFDVSINTIVWANNLSRNEVLTEGQTLIILPISGIRYKVKKGDTIKQIVLKYKTDLNEVLQYNDLSEKSILREGDIVIIPDAEPVVSPSDVLVTNNKNKNSFVKRPVHDANGPSLPGYYKRPITGGVRTQGLHGYNGVDLADAVGTPIYAAAEGVIIASVSDTGWHGGYGHYVIISHSNGTQTVYAHLSKNLVNVGQHVEQGQIIAKMGATGHATGPHVHFEVRGAQNPF